jgi:hypothetical protein
MPSDSELNRLLDEALQSYAAEPDDLLEHRILASVRAEADRSSKPVGAQWLGWGLAGIACLIVLGVAIFVSHSRRQPVQPETPAVAAKPQLPDASQQSGVRPLAEVRLHRTPVHQLPGTVAVAAKLPTEAPKLDVFPTPEPPTAEERALAAFSKNPPWNQQQQPSLVHAEELEVDPIRIAEIHVAPLPPVIEGEHY